MVSTRILCGKFGFESYDNLNDSVVCVWVWGSLQSDCSRYKTDTSAYLFIYNVKTNPRNALYMLLFGRVLVTCLGTCFLRVSPSEPVRFSHVILVCFLCFSHNILLMFLLAHLVWRHKASSVVLWQIL